MWKLLISTNQFVKCELGDQSKAQKKCTSYITFNHIVKPVTNGQINHQIVK